MSSNEQVKYILPEEKIPTHWYNIEADLPVKTPPPLDPATGSPMDIEKLRQIFSDGALEQEMEDIVLADCAALPIAFAAKNQTCSGAWLGLRADHGEGLFFTPAILRQQLQGMTNGR